MRILGVLDWLPIPLLLTVALVIFFTFFLYRATVSPRETKIQKTTRGWLINVLEQNRGHLIYANFVGAFLDRLDRRLSAPEIAAGQGEYRVAWSANLASLTLLLALAYPILAFVGQWLAGYPMIIGGVEFAPVGEGRSRAFVSVLLFSSFILYCLSALSKTGWRMALFIAASLILVGGPFLALKIEIAIPGAFAGAVTAALVAGVAAAGAFAGAGAGAVTITVAVTVAVTAAFAGAGAGTAAVTAGVAAAGALGGAVASEVIEQSRGHDPVWRFLAPIGMLSALTVILIAFWNPQGGDGLRAAYHALFFAIFPICNALADFASVGLTRLLVRRGLSGWPFKQGVWDFFLGGAIFTLLGITLITYLHLVRTPDGPLLDLPGLFAGLHADPGAHVWLGVMMISTLLPTMLHCSVAVFSLGFSHWAWLRNGVVFLLKAGAEGNALLGFFGALAVSALMALAVWSVCGFVWILLTLNHGWLLQGIISGFECYARAIGAV